MRRRTKNKLFVLLASLAAAFLLGGCSLGDSLEEVKKNNNLVAQVTYYSNGGEFEGTPDKKEMYYKEGKKALNIGVVTPTNGSAEIKRNNYVFDGWYHAVIENGQLVYEDEAKTTYKLGEKADFTVPLQKDDHWILVAKWVASVKVNIVLVCDTDASIPVKVKEGEEALSYQNGDIVAVRLYDTSDQVVNPGDGKAPFTISGKGYTFVEYYADEACTQPVQWPIKKQDADVTVYAKYVTGEWEVLRKAKDVSDMFSDIKAGKRYWLAKDIDATGRTISARTSFDGEIQGNGYAISNLKVQKSKIVAGSTVSMFGDIQATAVIENLNLTNVTIEYSLQTSPVNIYFVFASIAEGATIANVRVSGAMTITKADDHLIATIPNDNDYSNCLYGGFVSDADYIEQTSGKGFIVDGDAENCIIIKNL